MALQGITGTSIRSLEKEYETITNNLANVNSMGFKRTVNMFSRKLNQKVKDSANNPGVHDVNTFSAIDYSQGNVVKTDRRLDLALAGPGFFVVETMDGRKYTRNGNFSLSSEGQLINSEGEIVAGENGPIMVPKNVGLSDVNVSSDGNVTVQGKSVGKLMVADFADQYHKLTPIGKGNYKADDSMVPEILEKPVVKQGFQEASNVNMMEEMVGLLNVTRLYEANMKVLSKKSDDSRNLISLAMG